MDLRKVARLISLADKASRRQAVRALSRLADLWAFHTLKQVIARDKSRSTRELASKALVRCENGLVKRILKRIPEFKDASGHSYYLVERALRAVDPKVRCAGVRAAAIAQNVGFISPILDLAQQDHDERVVVTCLKALGVMGGKREANEVASFTNHRSANVRTAAILALSMIGNGASWVLLAQFASSPNEQLRQEALFFLSLIGEKQLNRVLSFMATSQDYGLARAALETAGKLTTKSSCVLLMLMMRHENGELRARAKELLLNRASNGDEEARKALQEAESSDEMELLHATKALLVEVSEIEEETETNDIVTLGSKSVELAETASEVANGARIQLGAVGAHRPRDASKAIEVNLTSMTFRDDLIDEEAHTELHDEDLDEENDEEFERAKEQLMTQSHNLPQPRLAEDSSLARGASDFTFSFLFGLIGVSLYCLFLSLIAIPLLALSRGVQEGATFYSVLLPLFLMFLFAWLLIPSRDRIYLLPLPLSRHPRLKRVLEKVKDRLSKEGLSAIPEVVLSPGTTTGYLTLSHMPFLPFGFRERLVLGSLLLPYLSVQELTVLIGRSLIEAKYMRDSTSAYLRQLKTDLSLMKEAYRSRTQIGSLINPVFWLLQALESLFLTLYSRRFRRAMTMGDQAAAVNYGANIVVDAITQAEVMSCLLVELSQNLLDNRKEANVIPINFYGELHSSFEHIFDNKRMGVKGRLMSLKTGPLDDKPALRDRIDAISHGTPRRTRAHREAWTLFEGRTDLERKLSNIIWTKAKW